MAYWALWGVSGMRLQEFRDHATWLMVDGFTNFRHSQGVLLNKLNRDSYNKFNGYCIYTLEYHETYCQCLTGRGDEINGVNNEDISCETLPSSDEDGYENCQFSTGHESR